MHLFDIINYVQYIEYLFDMLAKSVFERRAALHAHALQSHYAPQTRH
jgi:hypothetical protein